MTTVETYALEKLIAQRVEEQVAAALAAQGVTVQETEEEREAREAAEAEQKAHEEAIQAAFDLLFADAKPAGVSKRTKQQKYEVSNGKCWALLMRR